MNPQTGKAPEGARWRRQLRRLKTSKPCSANWARTRRCAQTTVYLTNMADFGEVNKLYAEVFGPDYPARTCVEVSALPMGLSIEVECIARAK
ncbi:MAG: RidA family protein [Christensenellales bacterium]